jgi:hypothetical protein
MKLPIVIKKGVFFMPFSGIIWATIICIPFWIIVILFVKIGIIAMETIILIGLVLSGLLLFLILTSSPNTQRDEKNKQLFSPTTSPRPFYNIKMEFKLADNGGTRTEIDRRKFHYTAYIPEKRTGMDRRKRPDRRNSLNHRGLYPIERRNIFRTQS